MSEERNQRVYELFQRACDAPLTDREAILDEECGTDIELKNEVLRLLARHDSGATLSRGEVLAATEALAEMPKAIGPYQLSRELGRGGMGVVYLAEQSSPQRLVAIKVLAASEVTPKQRARFELEADVLARLQHPNIAQIYECGTASISGVERPFFAMEYVQGRSLLEYAAAKSLDDNDRLALIVDLCQAVHHAHQKGVIHRDLKPANILVTDEGQLKVLDFGIARLTDADLALTTQYTNVGELVGTIPYMSPEQAKGDATQLDTRSDIYALGVVAYQLLSGQPPYELGQRLVHEALRIVQEEAPTPLSSVFPRFSGDIETIVNKALEKEPARRYQSATDLAADIDRHLQDQPILARPPSMAYQLRKFVRRNAMLVGGVTCILALLLATTVITLFMADRIRKERDTAILMREQADMARRQAEVAKQEAQQSAKQQEAISGFLQDVFASGSPYAGDKDTTVAEALNLAAERVDERLATEPEAAIAVRMRLSDTYFSMGKVFNAVQQMEAARKQAESAPTPNLADQAMIYASLGQLYLQIGNRLKSKEYLETAMTLIDDPVIRQLPARALTLVNYGALLIGEGEFAKAVPMLEESLQLREQEYGGDHPYTMTVRNNLAIASRRNGDLIRARELSQENMDAHRRTLGTSHPNTITGIYNHADLLRELEEFPESAALFQESIALGKEHLPTRHFLLGQYHSGFGELLRIQERLDEAETHLVLGFEILDEQLGRKHPQSKRALSRLVSLFEDLDDPKKLESYRQLQGE